MLVRCIFSRYLLFNWLFVSWIVMGWLVKFVVIVFKEILVLLNVILFCMFVNIRFRFVIVIWLLFRVVILDVDICLLFNGIFRCKWVFIGLFIIIFWVSILFREFCILEVNINCFMFFLVLMLIVFIDSIDDLVSWGILVCRLFSWMVCNWFELLFM